MFQICVKAGGAAAGAATGAREPHPLSASRTITPTTFEQRVVQSRASFDAVRATMVSLRAEAADALRTRDAATSAAVCRHVDAVLDAEFAAQRASGAKIACAAGCAFCCHQRVGVFAHEAAALLHELRERLRPAEAAEIERRILANARTVDGWTPEQHRSANLRCALLVEGRCAAYEVRPSACARYHSLSRARCEHSFEHPQDIGTPRNSRPALAALQELGSALESALEAALVDAGLSPAKGELHQTLRALLEDPSAWAGLTPSSTP
jgi:Fe-S-cluster containining protein